MTNFSKKLDQKLYEDIEGVGGEAYAGGTVCAPPSLESPIPSIQWREFIEWAQNMLTQGYSHISWDGEHMCMAQPRGRYGAETPGDWVAMGSLEEIKDFARRIYLP